MEGSTQGDLGFQACLLCYPQYKRSFLWSRKRASRRRSARRRTYLPFPPQTKEPPERCFLFLLSSKCSKVKVSQDTTEKGLFPFVLMPLLFSSLCLSIQKAVTFDLPLDYFEIREPRISSVIQSINLANSFLRPSSLSDKSFHLPLSANFKRERGFCNR